MKKNKTLKIVVLVVIILILLFLLSRCSNKKQEDGTVVDNNTPTIQETVKQEETVTPTPEVKEEVVVEETPVVEEVKEEKVDVTELSYWVNFLNLDGSVISRKAYKYGETPVAPVNPTYEDGVIYYSFTGWDKKASPVYGTQTYTVLYEKTGYVHKDEPTPVIKHEPTLEPYVIEDFFGTGGKLLFNLPTTLSEDNTMLEIGEYYSSSNSHLFEPYENYQNGLPNNVHMVYDALAIIPVTYVSSSDNQFDYNLVIFDAYYREDINDTPTYEYSEFKIMYEENDEICSRHMVFGELPGINASKTTVLKNLLFTVGGGS